MKQLSKTILSLLQKSHLDVLAIKITNNCFLNKVLMKFFWEDKDYKYYRNKYEIFREIIECNGISIENKSILEIGAGNSIGIGYFFYNENYNKWIASDYYRNPKNNIVKANKEYKLVKDVSEEVNKEIIENVSFSNESISFGDKFDFITLDIANYNKELYNSFDLIISNAVLEHIPSELMEASIKNMSRYLKKDGIMIHEIDLRDHINFSNPFHFYRYNKQDWNNLVKGTIFYTNRLRVKDYLDMFKKYHLKKIYNNNEKEEILPSKIDSYFKEKYTDDELRTKIFQIVLKK